MNTGHRWSPCRNAQMAMSGTLTASTAGVSVPGGPPGTGKGFATPAPMACPLPGSVLPALVLWGPAQLGVGKPSRPLLLRETQDTLPPPPSGRATGHCPEEHLLEALSYSGVPHHTPKGSVCGGG